MWRITRCNFRSVHTGPEENRNGIKEIQSRVLYKLVRVALRAANSRSRVTRRLAKFTIDLSVVEPEVAGRDAILSQKAAVHALCKYGKRFGGGGEGREVLSTFALLQKCSVVVIERAIISINFKGD